LHGDAVFMDQGQLQPPNNQQQRQQQQLFLGHLTSLTKLTLGSTAAIQRSLTIAAAAGGDGGGGFAAGATAALAPQLLPGSVLPLQLRELHLVGCCSVEPLGKLKHLEVLGDR
jgi:hypothetical protein